MSHARRYVAVLLNVLLLQASALGGRAACAGPLTHLARSAPAAALDAGARHTPYAQHAQHALRGGQHDHRAPSGQPAQDQAPSSDGRSSHQGPHGMPNCGTTMACSVLALVSVSPLPSPIVLAPGGVDAARYDAPRSATLAPEPPPPRA